MYSTSTATARARHANRRPPRETDRLTASAVSTILTLTMAVAAFLAIVHTLFIPHPQESQVPFSPTDVTTVTRTPAAR